MSGEPRSEDEDVERARRGDRLAFSRLLAAKLEPVRGFLFRLGVPDCEIDDRTQEVFVAVLRGFSGFAGDARFSTWLFGIAVNVARRARTGRREARPLEDASAAAAGDAAPDRRLLAAESGAGLRAALQRLPDLEREAFVLRHVQELSVAEAAAVLAVPEGTVRRRVFDARERLREILSPSPREVNA